MSRTLISWFGATDLRAAKGEASAGLGPVAQALAARDYDRVILLTNYDAADIAIYQSWLKKQTTATLVVRPEKLRSPTDYGDIHRVVSKTLEWLVAKEGAKLKLAFHLSPGTPAMATIWILLAPRYGAELIQSSQQAGVETANLPFEIAAEFVPAFVQQADAELERLGQGPRPEDPSFGDILHRSDAMKRVVARAQQAAPYTASVLIEGESGTGKELLAAAIHKASGRVGRILPINCGAIPKDLVESEFFGHMKGSFTGATCDKAGAFESADRSTLFLDEVGELPLDAQAKLLRVLQEKAVRRIGGTKEKKVDVRVIAATNRDLMADVAAGRFREDLYFRLAVLVLRSPPLREREGDVLLLVEHHLETLNADRPIGRRKKLSASAKNLFLRHPWPGNVRELQATLLRAFIWSKGITIDESAASEAMMRPATSREEEILHRPLGDGFRLQDSMAEVVRHYLTRALEQAHGNKTKAASLVGFANYQTLTNWAKRYGVDA
jgi:transcriptional regulator with GAF, ATPase, and Fis domain